MGRGPRYRVPFRRRREGRTDYRKRKAMILSGIPRLVVRGSLKHMSAQIITATSVGDRTLLAASSKELKRFGWEVPCGNLPAAYLTGFLLGEKVKASQIEHSILDIGLRGATRGARPFAALKGILDAELNVPHGEVVLPEDARCTGSHIAAFAARLAQSDPEAYERRFAKYFSAGVRPEKLPEYVQQVKTNVMERLKVGD